MTLFLLIILKHKIQYIIKILFSKKLTYLVVGSTDRKLKLPLEYAVLRSEMYIAKAYMIHPKDLSFEPLGLENSLKLTFEKKD